MGMNDEPVINRDVKNGKKPKHNTQDGNDQKIDQGDDSMTY